MPRATKIVATLGPASSEPDALRRTLTAGVDVLLNDGLIGADAVMLSAETATGRYPAETVEAMAQICVEAEKSDPVELDHDFTHRTFTRIDQSIAMATLFTAYHLRATAISSCSRSASR